jgi:hypothetical protein
MGEWFGLVVSFMNFQPCFNSLKSKNINSAVREDSMYLFTVIPLITVVTRIL